MSRRCRENFQLDRNWQQIQRDKNFVAAAEMASVSGPFINCKLWSSKEAGFCLRHRNGRKFACAVRTKGISVEAYFWDSESLKTRSVIGKWNCIWYNTSNAPTLVKNKLQVMWKSAKAELWKSYEITPIFQQNNYDISYIGVLILETQFAFFLRVVQRSDITIFLPYCVDIKVSSNAHHNQKLTQAEGNEFLKLSRTPCDAYSGYPECHYTVVLGTCMVEARIKGAQTLFSLNAKQAHSSAKKKKWCARKEQIPEQFKADRLQMIVVARITNQGLSPVQRFSACTRSWRARGCWVPF